MPVNKQVYARDLEENTAPVTISGVVDNNGASYTKLIVRVVEDNDVVETLEQDLSYSGNTASFSFSYELEARLVNTRFEVYGIEGQNETLLRTADEVVAGDVFIVQGQSNAEAGMYNGSANVDLNEFIRVYGRGHESGFTSEWYTGNGDAWPWDNANTGQWGMRLAALVLENQQVPVAVFNGAHGGKPVEFFQRNDNDPMDQSTNYGRLLARMRETNLTEGVRAIAWHQGESNAGGMTSQQYKDLWNELKSDWMEDFPSVEMFYVFQIRNGCGVNEENGMLIKEAHRQLAEESDNVDIMSTSGEGHHTDNCHYPYETGFRLFGNHLFGLVARDLYGEEGENIEAPQVEWAERTGDREVTLIMKNKKDPLTWEDGAENDFRMEGTGATVSSAEIDGYNVKLQFSDNISGMQSISYFGHQETAAPMVRNVSGIGAVHFYHFPVTAPWDRESAYVRRILDANGLSEDVESVTTVTSERITGLNLQGKDIDTLTWHIGYLSELVSLNLENNDLSGLPEEIVLLQPEDGLNVNGNDLCDLPDLLAEWVDEYAADTAWLKTQKCYVAGMELRFRSEPSFRVHAAGRLVRFSGLAENAVIKIHDAEGRLLETTRNSGSAITWENGPGLFIVTAGTGGRTAGRKIFIP